jgi:hypothetical protein
MTVDAVVTHHTDGFRSGVARFNELLAARLHVPLLGLPDAERAARPLLSFKASELESDDIARVEALLGGWPAWQVFLHEFRESPLEQRLVADAEHVFAGNAEIEQAVRPLNDAVELVWTPGLLTDDRPLPDVELGVFSFGMAHKIRTDMFRRLRELLAASGKRYGLFVSAANHETTSMRDAEEIWSELQAIFGDDLFFLGNLSDVAVADRLARTTYFAAFFTPAVRANNTSVASALERGAVVITNLDEFSPAEYVHMSSVIDIERCDALPTAEPELRELSRRGREAAAGASWDRLLERFDYSGRRDE